MYVYATRNERIRVLIGALALTRLTPQIDQTKQLSRVNYVSKETNIIALLLNSAYVCPK